MIYDRKEIILLNEIIKGKQLKRYNWFNIEIMKDVIYSDIRFQPLVPEASVY